MHVASFVGLFSSIVVDVSAQGGCTITPINPITLTTAGGVLALGTVNVTIRCNCIYDNGTVVDRVRWYDPDGTRLLVNYNDRYVAGTPYYIRELNQTIVVLVIPTFYDSYDGTYTCGRRVKFYPPGAPNSTINLIINGELYMQLVICVYI